MFRRSIFSGVDHGEVLRPVARMAPTGETQLVTNSAKQPRPGDDQTLSGAITRLRSEGFVEDFFATSDGQLACRSCRGSCDPAGAHIAQTVRFEGASNPDDESILLAIECECGRRGLYSTAYGPSASAEDAMVLRRLTDRSDIDT